jgi:hypothetical protein
VVRDVVVLAEHVVFYVSKETKNVELDDPMSPKARIREEKLINKL